MAMKRSEQDVGLGLLILRERTCRVTRSRWPCDDTHTNSSLSEVYEYQVDAVPRLQLVASAPTLACRGFFVKLVKMAQRTLIR
jgi:hypothetical protein